MVKWGKVVLMLKEEKGDCLTSLEGKLNDWLRPESRNESGLAPVGSE